jgi:hypothetical protein
MESRLVEMLRGGTCKEAVASAPRWRLASPANTPRRGGCHRMQ